MWACAEFELELELNSAPLPAVPLPAERHCYTARKHPGQWSVQHNAIQCSTIKVWIQTLGDTRVTLTLALHVRPALLDQQPHSLEVAFGCADVQCSALVCSGRRREPGRAASAGGGWHSPHGLTAAQCTWAEAHATHDLLAVWVTRGLSSYSTQTGGKPARPPARPPAGQALTVVPAVHAHPRVQQAAQQREVPLKHRGAQHGRLLHLRALAVQAGASLHVQGAEAAAQSAFEHAACPPAQAPTRRCGDGRRRAAFAHPNNEQQ